MPDASAIQSGRHLQPTAPLPTSFGEARAKADAISRALRRAARTARAPASLITGGAGFRGRKGDRAFRAGIIASMIALLLVPVAAMSIYWGLIASKQYSTEMKFALRVGEGSPLDALGGLFGTGSSQQAQDTNIVVDYITSRAIVDELNRQLDLRRIYGGDNVDYFSRFDRTDMVEELEKYWKKRVDVKLESVSGIIAVNVRAFTPEDSLALGSKIFSLSEALVNDLSTRSRRDALAQAKVELDRAEQRLKRATAAMRDARDSQGVLDAGASAEALNKVVTSLRMEMSRAEQDLASQGRGGADAPQSRVIQLRIGSLKSQIEDYSRQIASIGADKGSGTMADRMAQLSRTQTDLDLARQQYAQTSAVFENARVDVDTQHAYLVTAMRPTLAEKSTYPRRWWEWSIVVIPCLIAWGVLVSIAFVVRDNMAK